MPGGDVALMLPGYFVPGLASFLVGHLFFISVFKQGQAWFSSKGALANTLGLDGAMYAVLFNALPDPVLKSAVAAYVTVIALMAAQAIRRATVLRDNAACLVAQGAGIFMLSDTLIAINKFLTPIALSSLWILATYYAAQGLIVLQARES